MSDYIKYMYREYLEGRTRIKKVNEDQPLFPNTGAGLLIQKNKLTDDWTALNVSDGHYEEESFNHEALAAAFLQGANMGQLRMLNEILDRARLNGPYCLENVADALLSFAPACKAESLMENPMLHFIELSKSFSKNGGIYDPVHGIYIDSKVNGLGDVPHFTLYDVSVADIEECMAWGIKHLDEVPGQIHVVNGSPHIATIYVTGPDDRRINDLIFTLCESQSLRVAQIRKRLRFLCQPVPTVLLIDLHEVVRRPLAVIDPFLKPRSPRAALHHSFRLGQTPADLD